MRQQFLNIAIDNLSFEEALDQICGRIDHGQGGYVVTPNVDHIVRAETDLAFRKAYENACLVLTDGQPLIWISKLLKCPIKEKISGSDLLPRLCQIAAKRGFRMYFLGGAEGVAQQASRILRKTYPGLQICGTASPPVGFEQDPGQIREIWRDIQNKAPHILIVCLGTPKQELFLFRSQQELSHILAFGLGAALDFASGNVKRAPKWMQKAGLEWFFRLCQEPGRLFHRYLVQDLKIIKIVRKYRKGSHHEYRH